MRKFILYTLIIIVLILLTIMASAFVVVQDPEFGGKPLEDRAEILKASPHFHDEKFHNTVPERDYDVGANLEDMMGDQLRTPPAPFPLITPQFDEPVAEGLRATWFGHASVLVEIDGYRVFFDPMLSEYAYPVKAVAPQRMNPPPMSMEELPRIDAVVITHDHFDHLDMKTIQHLDKQGAEFFVGLGVGAHLETWGVDIAKMHEMDWGDTIRFKDLSFNCTEARHYSGRKSISKDTLWTSWVVQGPRHTVFHSGDSGYAPHFKQIGERFKTIDMSLIKVGDYGLDLGWQDIHMIPENSVQAHLDIGAKVMMPIHWGVFELSNHAWDEPIERTLTAADAANIRLVTPKLGQTLDYAGPMKTSSWWRDLQ
ncbi:MAG: MBL fold metallo-hydrolase [Gammaproteobacteria bacterium]|nr:MBL fold metallo-hydrolase [Gammaproteobacteria bacterium]